MLLGCNESTYPYLKEERPQPVRPGEQHARFRERQPQWAWLATASCPDASHAICTSSSNSSSNAPFWKHRCARRQPHEAGQELCHPATLWRHKWPERLARRKALGQPSSKVPDVC